MIIAPAAYILLPYVRWREEIIFRSISFMIICISEILFTSLEKTHFKFKTTAFEQEKERQVKLGIEKPNWREDYYPFYDDRT